MGQFTVKFLGSRAFAKYVLLNLSEFAKSKMSEFHFVFLFFQINFDLKRLWLKWDSGQKTVDSILL